MSEETNQQKCEKCIDELMLGLIKKSNEISKGVSLPKAQWVIFYRLQMMLHYYPNPQPQKVCDDEALAIESLKQQHDYSIGELAFIFQLSKSTIHSVLKQAKNS
jgi:hypothetical protein